MAYLEFHPELRPIHETYLKGSAAFDCDALQHCLDQLRHDRRQRSLLDHFSHLSCPEPLKFCAAFLQPVPIPVHCILIPDYVVPCLNEHSVDGFFRHVLSYAGFRTFVAAGVALPVGFLRCFQMGLSAINMSALAADDLRAEWSGFAAVPNMAQFVLFPKGVPPLKLLLHGIPVIP